MNESKTYYLVCGYSIISSVHFLKVKSAILMLWKIPNSLPLSAILPLALPQAKSWVKANLNDPYLHRSIQSLWVTAQFHSHCDSSIISTEF